MQVELVRVETSDGLGLEGSMKRPEHPASSLGIDAVICHHGLSGNFYRPYLFDGIGDAFLREGCAVLRVNNRGHDRMSGGGAAGVRPQGSVYEVIDDSRHDWRAWLDFAQAQGFRRIALWGQSLGAVKTVCYLATEDDARVVCAVASSPPRLSTNAANIAAEDLQKARQSVAQGQPDELLMAGGGRLTSAQALIDRSDNAGRYDFFNLLANVKVPLLLTLGGEETTANMMDLKARGPSLNAELPNVSYRLIDGADHSYLARIPELWDAARGWLKGVVAVSQRA